MQLLPHLHPSSYPDNFTKIEFVDSLLSSISLSWFAPLLEKNSHVLNNFETFMREFSFIFRESDRIRVAETKIKNLS